MSTSTTPPATCLCTWTGTYWRRHPWCPVNHEPPRIPPLHPDFTTAADADPDDD